MKIDYLGTRGDREQVYVKSAPNPEKLIEDAQLEKVKVYDPIPENERGEYDWWRGVSLKDVYDVLQNCYETNAPLPSEPVSYIHSQSLRVSSDIYDEYVEQTIARLGNTDMETSQFMAASGHDFAWKFAHRRGSGIALFTKNDTTPSAGLVVAVKKDAKPLMKLLENHDRLIRSDGSTEQIFNEMLVEGGMSIWDKYSQEFLSGYFNVDFEWGHGDVES